MSANAFSRTELLLGPRAMAALASSRVAIFGLGGVGSWAAEALARSGVGAFLLVDDEAIAPSNINRQVHATTRTVGRPKVDAMRERILEINPAAKVDSRFEHYSEHSAGLLLDAGLTYVVDAIDTVARKVDLILRAQALGLRVISSMGAGDKMDPTRLIIADIYDTDVCPLARAMRKRLRRRGVRALKVVYSREAPSRPFDARAEGEEAEELRPGKRASPGSNAFVPPAAGLAIAAEIVKDIAAAAEAIAAAEDIAAGKKEGEAVALKAVLFDMDGVLVDSESFIAQAAIAMLAERYGAAAEIEDFLPFVGMGENRFISGVAEKYGVAVDIEPDKARTYELYFELIRGRLREIPGAVAFVRACSALGLRMAVATSADRGKLDANLGEIGLSGSDFGATVTGLDVERRKPFPDIFLEAARRLGVPPGECLVVEDAVAGVRAAKAAGCACLALTGSFGEEELRAAGADAVLPDLALDPLPLLQRIAREGALGTLPST